MIRRPLLIAFAFALSALALFGALARITKMTLALERSERAALERATHEENVRIALWRLDATLAELIASENTRPASRFRSAAETTGLPWLGGLANGAIGASGTPVVRARFEVGADRKLRAEPAMTAPVWLAALPVPEPPPRPAPQRVARRPVAPAVEKAAAAEPPKENDPPPRVAAPAVANAAEPPPPQPAAQPNAAQNAAQQNSLQNVAQFPAQQNALRNNSFPSPAQRNSQRNANLNSAQQNTQQTVAPAAAQNQRAGLPKAEETPPPPPKDLCAELLKATGVPADRINATCNESGQQSAYSQEALNVLSFQRRKELAQQSTLVRPAGAPPGVEVESAFEARWMGGDLVLLRRVRRGDERLLQGTWIDWPALSALLLSRIAAVVPASGLVPAADGDGSDPGRRLALLPARLVPGPMPETEPRDWTPVRLSVAAAWLAAVLGLVGVGSLLKGSVTLSQRRADFVSAVTHELRTPLTTFRLYTDMLLGGMVPAGERPSYLATLKSEADRLGHLVENVLAFSRLERRAGAMHVETLALGDLLSRAVPRLAERAAQAGLALQVESDSELNDRRVRADPAGAEQILLNLVDNACKYACNAAQPALELSTSPRGRHAVLRLHDHGPGIDRRERRRIFRPFHRPAAQAAGSAPGVGLGLALSRRLARRMGGDLRLAVAEEGASFELWLRRESPPKAAVRPGPHHVSQSVRPLKG